MSALSLYLRRLIPVAAVAAILFVISAPVGAWFVNGSATSADITTGTLGDVGPLQCSGSGSTTTISWALVEKAIDYVVTLPDGTAVITTSLSYEVGSLNLFGTYEVRARRGGWTSVASSTTITDVSGAAACP